MATNAETQKAYRRRAGETQLRINTFAEAGAVMALRRIARHKNLTIKQTIEEILNDAEQLLIESYEDDRLKNPRKKAFREYYADFD